MSTRRDLVREIHQYRCAHRLLALGARVPVVMDLTHLSSWFLRKLSRDIQGIAPRKGQVPNSEQWYLRRKNLVQSSLFCALYESMRCNLSHPDGEADLLATTYTAWQEIVSGAGLTPQLSIDRAWWLIKSLKIKNLQLSRCQGCRARYLQAWGKLERHFQCDDCRLARGGQGNGPRYRMALNA